MKEKETQISEREREREISPKLIITEYQNETILTNGDFRLTKNIPKS
jgi:hypothetical protein